MIISRPTKKNIFPLLLLFLCTLALTFQSCKKKRSDMAKVLFKKTRNNVFKNIDPDEFAEVFKKVLADDQSALSHPGVISSYYKKNDYYPVFLMEHLPNDDLKNLPDYYDKADEHGLNPRMFQSEEIRELLAKFYDKRQITTVEQAYDDMAHLELMAANSLINYSNDLQYGAINPKKIYSRYFMATKEPDSASISQIFLVRNFKTYLDSIQPTNPQYLTLQKALMNGEAIGKLSKEESRRLLIVALERLRWKNKPAEHKYVMVNIPDYHLDVVDSGKSVLGMKVCVGQGRNMDNIKTLVHYDDTDKVDNAAPHETPMLNSLIHSVQVNPIWNIPESIANNEIIVEAAKDPYYLSNKGIDVYKNDKKIDDSESINWDSIKDKSEYSFKQEPGSDNALGKIKFLFNNKSSVYLHDTPAKAAFYQKMRAVSHGCVRLGDPDGLALELFGQGDDYDKIKEDMSEDNPDPTTIYLPKKTPVYITYVTCWPDENGVIQARPDVYELDIVLYAHLNAAGVN
jgi:murein L,D-transpeptidase YcbB/YkuD